MSDSNRGQKLGYWILAVALIVTVSVFGWVLWNVKNSTSANWSDYQNYSEKIRAETERYVGERCLGISDSAREHCVGDAEKTAHDREQSEADLYAQRQMAVWAFAVGITGMVSVLLSLAGVFFVWRSLSEMAAQRRIGEVSNKANQAAADAQFGAKIEILGGAVTINSSVFNMSLVVRNNGKTPAHKVQVHCNIFYYPEGEGIHPRNLEALYGKPGMDGEFVVLDGESFEAAPAHLWLASLPSEHISGIMGRPKFITASVGVRWSTAFGLDHSNIIAVDIRGLRKANTKHFGVEWKGRVTVTGKNHDYGEEG